MFQFVTLKSNCKKINKKFNKKVFVVVQIGVKEFRQKFVFKIYSFSTVFILNLLLEKENWMNSG